MKQETLAGALGTALALMFTAGAMSVVEGRMARPAGPCRFQADRLR